MQIVYKQGSMILMNQQPDERRKLSLKGRSDKIYSGNNYPLLCLTDFNWYEYEPVFSLYR